MPNLKRFQGQSKSLSTLFQNLKQTQEQSHNMVDATISFIYQRLGKLIDEVKLHADVRDKVKHLREELNGMRSFLSYADGMQSEDERVRNYVRDIRNLAYDAEDVIDNFVLTIDPMTKKNFVMRGFAYPKEYMRRSGISDLLEDIRSRLVCIANRRQTYDIRDVGEGRPYVSERLKELRRSYPHDRETDTIVGLEGPTDELVKQIVQQHDRRWRAFSIVGMGGIGKTTLAKRIYHNSKISERFPTRAWVYVSQDFRTGDRLKEIFKQIGSGRETLENLTDEQLVTELHDSLKTKRYLVVLDDLWRTDDWDLLKEAFPDRRNGSRLLITTRNKSVSLRADNQTVPYDLQLLREDYSWELFRKKAGLGDNFSSVLRLIGEEILRRCGGLPLAIIVIGGSLSRERAPEKWKRTLNTMDSYLKAEPDRVSAILALSYNDLPNYLKPCFLYLGHFPEDYAIPTNKLFRLWAAEGLVPHREEWAKAEDYLNKLIERNMVQVAKTSVSGRVKQIRLHDLLRELAISTAKNENFLEIPVNGNSSLEARCRRHPIYSISHLCSLQNSTSCVRSLVFIRVTKQVRYTYFELGRAVGDFNGLSDAVTIDYINRKFKLLRILELEGISCGSIPDSIGKLIHLKYLGLRQTNIQELPPKIGSLKYLQTLDIAGNPNLRTVPNGISKLKNLVRLYLCGHKHQSRLLIDKLNHLQTLSKIHVDEWMQNYQKLTRLRKLGIRGDLNSDTRGIFNSIAALPTLQSLCLHAEPSDFQNLSELASLRYLDRLHLRGRIRQMCSPQEFPPILSHLTLEETSLKQDEIEVIGNLPTLRTLRLKAMSYCEQSLAMNDGFRQLEHLELNSLDSLETLSIQFGALTVFRVVNCPRLTQLLGGFLQTLQQVDVGEMPNEFVQRLRKEHAHKVQIVPT